MTESIDAYLHAVAFQDFGYTVLPIRPGKKQPLIRWKHLQSPDKRLSDGQLKRYFLDTDNNIAILTNDVVVADCDDPALAELVLKKCGKSPTVTKTPSGGLHFWYRARKGVKVGNQVRIKGHALDLRAKGAYIMTPPSRIEGVPYSWVSNLVPAKDMPCFKVTWTRQRKRRPRKILTECGQAESLMIARARAYIEKVEGAISGQGGHNRTFRVACALTQKFNLTFEQAWPLLFEWNCRCLPPWTVDELKHKLFGSLNLPEKP